MKTKVQKWGNSLAVRIPKPFAAETGLENGSSIDLSLDEGRLILSPSSDTSYTLKKLLQGITPENVHGEFDSGRPVGREVW